MNIEGTYKVNIEQSVRKMTEAEHDSIVAIVRKYAGNKVDEIPPDPRKEAQIQKMIAEFQQDELATTLRLVITADRASIRSTDGDGDYPIKQRTVTGENQLSLVVELPDMGEDMQWDITVVADRFLVFSGDNEMGNYVFERV